MHMELKCKSVQFAWRCIHIANIYSQYFEALTVIVRENGQYILLIQYRQYHWTLTEQVAKFTRATLKIHSLAHIFSFFGFWMNDKIMTARVLFRLDTAKRYLEAECIVNNIDRMKKMQFANIYCQCNIDCQRISYLRECCKSRNVGNKFC